MVSLLLARLLAPEYFGLISIATLAISSLVFFQELGFSAALVYRQDDVEAAANTAHWTIIASSVVLYIIGFILAPLVARFFRSPDVTPILRALSLTIVISSLSRVSYTLLFKGHGLQEKGAAGASRQPGRQCDLVAGRAWPGGERRGPW